MCQTDNTVQLPVQETAMGEKDAPETLAPSPGSRVARHSRQRSGGHAPLQVLHQTHGGEEEGGESDDNMTKTAGHDMA